MFTRFFGRTDSLTHSLTHRRTELNTECCRCRSNSGGGIEIDDAMHCQTHSELELCPLPLGKSYVLQAADVRTHLGQIALCGQIHDVDQKDVINRNSVINIYSNHWSLTYTCCSSPKWLRQQLLQPFQR